MMRSATGQVTIDECPSKSKLFRFCEKKIDQWLEAHPSEIHAPAEFRVTFTNEADQVSCVTEIQLGEKVLRGCDVDGDTQVAFLHSLKHLHTAQASL